LPDIAGKAKREIRRHLRACGAWLLPGTTLAAPGTDVHYAGTLPMGGGQENGTTALGELNGAPGIHVVDGAVLPSLSAKYPTLTIMANAARIGHALARES
jgi:choline dehydrogenase-like flavoprotein